MSAVTEYRPTKYAILALVLALAGFVVTFGESGQRTVNGEIVESYQYNYAAIVLGAGALLVAGYEALSLARGSTRETSGALPVHYVALGLVALLGIYQVLAGSDIL